MRWIVATWVQVAIKMRMALQASASILVIPKVASALPNTAMRKTTTPIRPVITLATCINFDGFIFLELILNVTRKKSDPPDSSSHNDVPEDQADDEVAEGEYVFHWTNVQV